MKKSILMAMVVGATTLFAMQALAVPVMVTECTEDADCMDGSVCEISENAEIGTCVWDDDEDVVTCMEDADCPNGHYCLIAVTGGPDMPTCDEDDPDCEEGKAPPAPQPTEGICVEETQSCTSDADCVDGEICIMYPGTGGTGGSTRDPSEGFTPQPDPESEGEGEGDTEMPGGPSEGYCAPDNGGWESECETDADCPTGMICDEIGSMVKTDVACICPDGEEDCDCGEMEPSEPEVVESYYACVPAPCESDADCGDGLVCFTETYESCPPVAMPAPPVFQPCPEDDPDCEETPQSEPQEPDEPEEDDAECETVTNSFCAPQYFANCEVDADCGEGFSCIEEEMCACSAGGGTGTQRPPIEPTEPGEEESDGSDSSAAEPVSPEEQDPEEPDCECELTGDMICELQELPCEGDDDCEIEGWLCLEGPTFNTPCTFDADTGEEDCGDTSEQAAGQCVPPTWNWGDHGGFGEETANSGTSTGETGPRDPNTPNPDDGTGDGTGSGSGDGTGTGTGDGTDGTSSSGGCQGGSGTPTGLIGLALLALAAITRRRLALER